MKSLRELMCNCRRLSWWRNRLQPDELLTLLILVLIAVLLLLSSCQSLECRPSLVPRLPALSSPNLSINHPAGMVDNVSFSCRAAF